MNSKRTFFLMIGLSCLVAIGIVAAVVMGNKMLEQESQKLLALKVENQVLEKQQTDLVKANKDISRYSNLAEITQKIVPQDKDQARAVREVVELANSSGFALQSVTFPSSNLGAAAPADPSTGAPAPSVSQAKPVSGIPGVYSLEMSIVPKNKVTYYQFIDFLSKMEKNRRTAQVTRIKIDPGSTDGKNASSINFDLTVNIFVKP